MSVEAFKGLVLVAVVDDGAIVAGEYQDGVVRQLEAVEGVHDLSDGPVELQGLRLRGFPDRFSRRSGDVGTRGTCTSCVPYIRRKVLPYGRR